MLEIVQRVICDRCGAISTESLESEPPRAAVKAEGWVCTQEEDICPRCAAKDSPSA